MVKTEKVELRPCVSCGTPVPEITKYPYRECPDTCELSAQWRREYEEAQDAGAIDRLRLRAELAEARIRRATALMDDAARLWCEAKPMPGLVTLLDMFRAALCGKGDGDG